MMKQPRVILSSVSSVLALLVSGSVVAQVPPPPGPAAPMPPPPPAAPPLDTGAASGDNFQGVNPDVAPAEPPAGAATTEGNVTAAGSGELSVDSGTKPTVDSATERTITELPAEDPARDKKLRNHPSLRGSTGLLRVNAADSGPVGSVRFGLLGSYLSTSRFLCPQCEAPDGGSGAVPDDVTRSTLHVQVGATVLPYLEAYLGVHSTATYNSRGTPTLLQNLGDSTWGIKGFMPHVENRVFSAGGAAELQLLNGSGNVGISNASVALRALGTADFTNRSKASERLPLRIHVNVSYVFDNSGALIEADEVRRGREISRIERFGMNINRVDQLVPAIAVEGVFKYANPFMEWSIDVPSNRQGYTCRTARVAAGDECLNSYAQFSAVPARLTLGARAYGLLDGLSGIAALDVATGGVNAPFWQETQPEAPWNVWLGVSYAVDTKPRIVERVISVPTPTAPERTDIHTIQGRVVVEGTTDVPVASAIVRYDGVPLTGMVTDELGRFETRTLPPGEYRFGVSAQGYESASCAVVVSAQENASSESSSVSDGQESHVTQVVCPLKAKPKVGNIEGAIASAEGKPIADAKVTVTDRLGRSLSLQVDDSGAFRFENVPPGPARVQIAAKGYLATTRMVEVPPGDELRLELDLNPVPVPPNVVLAKNEITVRTPIEFREGSKELLPTAEPLLDELATLLLVTPDLGLVEVQVHTSNASPSVLSMQVSQQRAEVLVAELVNRGVPAQRLRAQGYGDSLPIAPNTTEQGRKKNERVQLVVSQESNEVQSDRVNP